MTYRKAYNKIIDAYFNNEIKPFNSTYCFCGTLCGGRDWVDGSTSTYDYVEYGKMEAALFSKFPGIMYISNSEIRVHDDLSTPEWKCIYREYYEDIIFEGMCAALEVLKQIHIKRGEVIDEELQFTKRKLAKA